MAINKTAGETLTFEEIENEFGQIPGANNRKLGSYRVNYSNTDSGGGLSNQPLDEGVPQSGPIKFSDFYGKKLNIVVDCYSSPAPANAHTRIKAKDNYDNGDAEVIGPGYFPSLPNSNSGVSGKKIIINVNTKFQSASTGPLGDTTQCALRTGQWQSGTSVQVDVSGSGKIMGTGGDGGQGGPDRGSGYPGKDGSSGLGIEQENTVVNVHPGGAIITGYGGGGGGGWHKQRDWGRTRNSAGGGGGGGAGAPNSFGGAAGAGEGSQSGGPGLEPMGGEQGGAGGAGGNDAGEAIGGVGGRGGDQLGAAQAGESRSASGGAAGNNGAAIRRSSGSISWTYGATHVGNVWGAGGAGASESGTGVS